MAEYDLQDAATVWAQYTGEYGIVGLTRTELDAKYVQILHALTDGESTGNIQLDEYIQAYHDSPIGVTAREELEGKGPIAAIGTFIVKGITWLMTSIASIVGIQLGDIGRKVFRRAMDDAQGYNFGPVYSLFDRMVSDGYLDQESADDIRSSLPESKPMRFIMAVVLYALMRIKGAQAIFNTAGGDYQKLLLNKYTPSQLSPESLAAAARKAPALTDAIREKLQDTGLAVDDQNLLFLSNVSLLGVNEIRQLYLRGELTDTEVFEKMRQLGFTDTTTGEIAKLFEVIPPIQDIIQMVAKEAFEPSEVARFGLDDEFPTAVSEWFEKLGLSSFWQHKYWQAHWNQISIGQGFEMLHRGVINEAELDGLFKAQEIPPFWREKLKQISYNVLTRVDIRRMYDIGVLNEEQILETYQKYGYNLEDAARMTEFTIKYYEDDDKNLTRSQLETYYRTGLITEEDAAELLGQLGYSWDRIQYILAYQDFKRAEQERDDLIDTIKDRYVYHIIDESEAQTDLFKLNLLGTKVNALIQSWQVARLRNRKLPSKTDLDKFFREGVITLDIYMEELDRLGYSERYVQMYATYILSQMGLLNDENT